MVKVFTTSRYKIDRSSIVQAAESYLQRQRVNHDMVVNIVFIGKRKMKKIAQDFKSENEALPVLSFRYGENELLGEIFICYPQAILLAAERDRGVDETIMQLLTHGIDNIVS